MKKYYTGSYREDGLNGPNAGWLVGRFKDEPPLKNDAVEIKYWEYKAGPAKHDTKVSSIIECTFILKGSVEGMIDGKRLTFRAGEYVVIKPGTPNNLVINVLEDVAGLTIKAPSDPNAKTIIE